MIFYLFVLIVGIFILNNSIDGLSENDCDAPYYTLELITSLILMIGSAIFIAEIIVG